MRNFPDDESLVAAAVGGNRRARRMVADRLACVPRMIRHRRGQLGAALQGKEEDLVQDVVLAVWSRLERFRGGSSLEAWVWGFVLRITYRRVERIQRRPRQASIDDQELEVVQEEGDPLQVEERGVLVHGALEELDAVSRKIVMRRHFEGEAFEAIGESMNMPTNTAKTRYYRGLRTLESKLRQLVSEL